MTVDLEEPRYRLHRSYTQLSTWEQCPALYRFKYVERLREQPSVWSVGGTAFHQVAEWYLGGDLRGDLLSLANAWAVAWDLAVKDLVDRGADPDLSTWRAANRGRENAAWWKGAGLQMVNDFADWKRAAGSTLGVADLGDGPALESQIRTQLGGVNVLAIPDWIAFDEHGQIDIVDYKSGKPPKESTQLGFYRAAIRAHYGVDPTWGLYYMARDAAVIPVDLAKHDPDAITERVVAFDQAERAEEYTPKPGRHCNFCPFAQQCPLNKESE